MGPKAKNLSRKASNIEKLQTLVDPIVITLKILEIYNLDNADHENIMDVTFMNEKLQGVGEVKFTDCACRPDINPLSKWTLELNNVDEEVIMDLSSNPLVISIAKVESGPIEGLQYISTLLKPKVNKEENTTPRLKVDAVAYSCVDLYDLVSDEITTIRSNSFLVSPIHPIGEQVRTVANMPYLKYILTTSKPIVTNELLGKSKSDTNKLYTVTITTEFIMHPTPLMFEKDNEFEVNISLPINEKYIKTISFKQGYKCKFADIPEFKSRYGLTKIPGDVKYTKCATSKSLNFNDLIIKDDCNLPEYLVRNYSELICCEEIYRFKQPYKSILQITDAEKIPIEVICKQGSKIVKYTGLADFNIFSYVNQTKSRQAIPLISVEVSSSRWKGSAVISSKAATLKGRDKNKDLSKSVEITAPSNIGQPDVIKNPYAECEDGYNTCLILEIEFDKPLIALKEEKLDVEVIRWTEHPKFFESPISMVDKDELNAIFEAQILKFATTECVQDSGKRQSETLTTTKMWSTVDNDLFGCSALMIANKYNFNQSMEEDEMEDILHNAYIYLVNSAYDIVNNNQGLVTPEIQDLMRFRIQCGEECRELGFPAAKHFYIMNLRESSSSPECLLDYAVHNLLTGDIAKAMECCLDATAKNPNMYDSYLLQAYIQYLKRDRKSCEATLQYAIKTCNNYLEAWVAIFLMHADSSKNTAFDSDSDGIENANAFPYIGHLHKLDPIVWAPDQSSNSFLISISNYIKWGCIEFAELALAYVVCKLGHDSFAYLFHTALADYMHARYINALEKLNRIKTNCNLKVLKIKRLKAHCYLGLNNQEVTNLMQVLSANFTEQKKYTPRCNLMNLKMAKFFIENNKFKAGRYYLKKCCKQNGTYVSFIELGNASLKCRSFDVALKCFKMAHSINPYDWYPWSQLAVVYFRSGLKQQYYICAKNARANKISDKSISRELDKIDEILNQQE